MKMGSRLHPFGLGLLSLATIGWHAPAVAEREYAPLEELVRTEMVFPQEKGEVQVSLRLAYARGAEGGDGWSIPLTAEYGLTDRLQIELGWEGYQRIHEEGETRDGVGNLGISLQYSWLDIANSGINIAAGAEYEFATGDADVILEEDDDDDAERGDSYELYLIVAKDLNSFADKQILVQIGVEHEEDAYFDFVNLAGYAKVGRNLAASLEYNWHEEGEERYISPALAWKAGASWELGLGVSIGVHEEADDYQIIGRVTREWE